MFETSNMRTILFISMLAFLVALAATHSNTDQNEVFARDSREIEARRASRHRNQKKKKLGKPRNKPNKKKPGRGKFSRNVNVKALMEKGKLIIDFVTNVSYQYLFSPFRTQAFGSLLCLWGDNR